MDEVEHRRRRTRSARATDALHDGESVADDPSTRTVGVTPADIAERAAAGPAGSSEAGSQAGPPVAVTMAALDLPSEPVTVDPPTVRTGAESVQRHTRTRPEGGSSPRGGEDRHLPFDAHTAHPINEERDGERGLRGLIGSGATQVSVGAAMRARDASRPTEAELAEAEATLTIVHRGWVPRGE